MLINNNGYTIERVIHGPSQKYNDISTTWDYQNMLKFFGSKNAQSYSAHTYEELHNVLTNPEFQAAQSPQLLEVFMDKFDAPWMLTAQVNGMQKKAARQLAAWDKSVGRERWSLDTNLYQSGFALRDSESNRYLQQKEQENQGYDGDSTSFVNGYSAYGDETPALPSKN